LPNGELLQHEFALVKESDKNNLCFAYFTHKHIRLLGKLSDEDKQVLLGYLPSYKTKYNLELFDNLAFKRRK